MTPRTRLVRVALTLSNYFGRRPGQSLLEFRRELEQLSNEDRIVLCEMIRREHPEKVVYAD